MKSLASAYLQGIDNAEIIDTVNPRRAPIDLNVAVERVPLVEQRAVVGSPPGRALRFAPARRGADRGGTLKAHGDHRLAMLGAVAGLASRGGVEVVGMEAAAVSYPGFERDLGSLLG